MKKTKKTNDNKKLSSEPFTPFVYGSKEWGKLNNSCYPYALDMFKGKGNSKLQPGQLAKTYKITDDLTDPKTLKKRVLEDLKTKKDGGYESSPNAKCRPGYYKIMAFVAPGRDFHFYRQVGDMLITSNGKKTIDELSKNVGVDRSKLNSPSYEPKDGEPVLIKDAGLYSHKRGHSVLTTKDASGKFIKDPRKADRNYGDLNYTTYAGTFCVNNSFGKGQSVSCVDKKKKLTKK